LTAPSTATGRARSARGFTIIELMVVMTIIVTLATIAMVQYRQSVQFAKESVLRDDLFKLRDAIDQYYADKNQYPPTLEDLVSAGYIRALPKDPITNSTSTWQAIPSEPDPNNPSVAPGVYDVKSGSELTGMDGSHYSDW
jgi:general secretion pathway protein G